jgi:hypothetical protein
MLAPEPSSRARRTLREQDANKYTPGELLLLLLLLPPEGCAMNTMAQLCGVHACCTCCRRCLGSLAMLLPQLLLYAGAAQQLQLLMLLLAAAAGGPKMASAVHALAAYPARWR